MMKGNSTRFIVVSGGLASGSASLAKCESLLKLLPKDAKTLAVNCSQGSRGKMVLKDFLLRGNFSRRWRERESGQEVEVGSAADIEACLLNLEKLRKPDFLLLELGGFSGRPDELMLETVKRLEGRIGRNGMLFVHIALSPGLDNLNGVAIDEQEKSRQLLERMKIKPNLIIDGLEARWIQ